jgi:hypothetical protein
MRRLVRAFGLAAIAGVLIVGALFASAAPASADSDMTWHFRNTTNKLVAVQLYSQSRAHLWPESNTTLLIPTDGVIYKYTISCVTGEKICYGGWIAGAPNSYYWGVGYNGRDHCPSCCGTCGDAELPTFALDP